MPKGCPFDPTVKARAIRLYLDGATLQEAGTGCNPRGPAPTGETVRLWLRDAGVTTRRRGRPRFHHARAMVLDLARSRAMSAAEIGRAVGVSRAAAADWMREAGLGMTRSEALQIVTSRHIPTMRRELQALVAQGKNFREIVQLSGYSAMTVWRHLREMGLRAADGRKTWRQRGAA